MSGSVVHLSSVLPGGHLDQGTLADQTFVPTHLVGANFRPALPFVLGDEATCESSPERSHQPPSRSRNDQRRFGQQERCVRQIERSWSQKGAAPVDDGEVCRVDQDVQRVKVAMADDMVDVSGPVVQQPIRG